MRLMYRTMLISSSLLGGLAASGAARAEIHYLDQSRSIALKIDGAGKRATYDDDPALWPD